jgi:hypothetical protein
LAEAASHRLDELLANNHEEDQSGRTAEPHMHTESDPEPAPFAIVVDDSEAQQHPPLADQVTTTSAATHTPSTISTWLHDRIDRIRSALPASSPQHVPSSRGANQSSSSGRPTPRRRPRNNEDNYDCEEERFYMFACASATLLVVILIVLLGLAGGGVLTWPQVTPPTIVLGVLAIIILGTACCIFVAARVLQALLVSLVRAIFRQPHRPAPPPRRAQGAKR